MVYLQLKRSVKNKEMKNFNWNFVLAIIAALATMLIVIIVVEQISHEIHPPTVGLNHKDKEAVKQFMLTVPFKALILIPIGWVLGAFAGAFVGGTISKSKKRIIFFVVAIFTLLASISQLISIPHPWYFWAIAAFIFPGALFGSRLVRE